MIAPVRRRSAAIEPGILTGVSFMNPDGKWQPIADVTNLKLEWPGLAPEPQGRSPEEVIDVGRIPAGEGPELVGERTGAIPLVGVAVDLRPPVPLAGELLQVALEERQGVLAVRECRLVELEASLAAADPLGNRRCGFSGGSSIVGSGAAVGCFRYHSSLTGLDALSQNSG